MATISSAGIGSGLDVKSIVSQLVAIEKQPLVALQTADASIQSKISTFGQIKSLVSTFADATSKLTLDSGWNNLTVSSSDSSAVNATISGLATTGNYSFGVSQLAQAQTTASGVVASGTTLGTGSITLQVGSAAAVTVNIADTDDTSLTGIAAKINDAGAGVSASVITDSTGQRLMLRSSTTGAASGFTVSAASSGTSTGLSGLAFATTQVAQDTKAKINGVDVTSSSRTFADTIPGLTFTASQITTTPAEIAVTADTATTTKNIQAFVDAYNAVNDLLASNTKYDADTKTAGLLQGDSTTVSLENQLRAMMGSVTKSGGAYSTLSDIGVSMQQGGDLTVDPTKLASALSTTSGQNDVKKLFATTTSGSDATNGIAVKFQALTTNLLGLQGTFANKSASLASADKLNLSQQDDVNTHAATVETRLNAQYTALDTQMATLTSLNDYISQQITTWNKST
ncbi:MAG: flagellar filament capping protein FliD [Pseudomonadota bacterium]